MVRRIWTRLSINLDWLGRRRGKCILCSLLDVVDSTLKGHASALAATSGHSIGKVLGKIHCLLRVCQASSSSLALLHEGAPLTSECGS